MLLFLLDWMTLYVVSASQDHGHFRVNRAVSTHCVASLATGNSQSNSEASPGHERGKSLSSDFLASRAKELIASLKALMRSDSKCWFSVAIQI